MSEMSTYAFKLFERLEARLERIEVLLGRLADAKDDREAAAALTADVKQRTGDLDKAVPPA